MTMSMNNRKHSHARFAGTVVGTVFIGLLTVVLIDDLMAGAMAMMPLLVQQWPTLLSIGLKLVNTAE